jgi:hypothetical protein
VLKNALFFIGRWATNILLACLAIASSVRPEDAMSNISGWASKFNLPDPIWLQSHTADSVIFWSALTGVFMMLVAPKVWKKFKRKPATHDVIDAERRDVALSDALWRAFEGAWEKRTKLEHLSNEKSSNPQSRRFYAMASEIRQKAFDGILPIWAKRPRSNLYESVPKDFWTNHDIQAGYSLHPDSKDIFVYATHPLIVGEVPYSRTNAWEDFMTNRKTVERLWPRDESSKQISNARTSDFANDIPDVRIADDVVAEELFESGERDKLLPLLEGGKIDAWGRLGNGHPPLMKIPSDLWRTNYLVRYPASSGGINQTFLKSKVRHETTYYDVHLNRAQLERVWPNLWSQASLDRIPCTELLRMAAAAGWDFISNDSLHLLDLQDAMRQGGSDDRLAIWGKLKKWTSDDLMRTELLEKIEPSHWKEFFIHLHAAAQNDNFNTYSWTPDQRDFGRRGYVDLHVDRSQAISWLRRDASSFRGRAKPR